MSCASHEYVGMQVLRAGEDVEAEEVEAEGADRAEKGRNEFRIDAELLRAAAHAHSRTLDLEVRVDPQRDARPLAEPFAGRRRPPCLALRFELDHDARGDCTGQFPVRLARACEAHAAGRHSGVERRHHLDGGGNVEPVDQRRHVLHHGRHRDWP